MEAASSRFALGVSSIVSSFLMKPWVSVAHSSKLISLRHSWEPPSLGPLGQDRRGPLKGGWFCGSPDMGSLCEFQVLRVRVGWPVGCPARVAVGVGTTHTQSPCLGRQEAECPTCPDGMGITPVELLPHTPQLSWEHTSPDSGLHIGWSPE